MSYVVPYSLETIGPSRIAFDGLILSLAIRSREFHVTELGLGLPSRRIARQSAPLKFLDPCRAVKRQLGVDVCRDLAPRLPGKPKGESLHRGASTRATAFAKSCQVVVLVRRCFV